MPYFVVPKRSLNRNSVLRMEVAKRVLMQANNWAAWPEFGLVRQSPYAYSMRRPPFNGTGNVEMFGPIREWTSPIGNGVRLGTGSWIVDPTIGRLWSGTLFNTSGGVTAFADYSVHGSTGGNGGITGCWIAGATSPVLHVYHNTGNTIGASVTTAATTSATLTIDGATTRTYPSASYRVVARYDNANIQVWAARLGPQQSTSAWVTNGTATAKTGTLTLSTGAGLNAHRYNGATGGTIDLYNQGVFNSALPNDLIEAYMRDTRVFWEINPFNPQTLYFFPSGGISTYNFNGDIPWVLGGDGEQSWEIFPSTTVPLVFSGTGSFTSAKEATGDVPLIFGGTATTTYAMSYSHNGDTAVVYGGTGTFTVAKEVLGSVPVVLGGTGSYTWTAEIGASTPLVFGGTGTTEYISGAVNTYNVSGDVPLLFLGTGDYNWTIYPSTLAPIVFGGTATTSYQSGVATGQWISGVVQYRNKTGVANVAHLEDGTEISSVSRDKIAGVYERWWIE